MCHRQALHALHAYDARYYWLLSLYYFYYHYFIFIDYFLLLTLEIFLMSHLVSNLILDFLKFSKDKKAKFQHDK